jgi:hypothetical protein
MLLEHAQLATSTMQTLADIVIWRASEHPEMSRGMIASGAAFLVGKAPPLGSDLIEKCFVMTRKQAYVIVNFSRTSVFNPEIAGQGGILYWRTGEAALLKVLHNQVIQICAEVGFSEFCVMCEARGPSAPFYWQEMLGDHYHYLKKHS